MRLLLSLFVLAFATQMNAQCETWVGQSNETEIMEWHTIYRGALKSKDYAFAEENWIKAYEAAPAADGKRGTHYTDGIKIYKQKIKAEKDKAAKAELGKKLLEMYDAAIACYESKSISMKCNTDKCYAEKVGELKGRKGFDMYYTTKSSMEETNAVLRESLNTAGDELEYRILSPTAYSTVKLYEKGALEKDVVVELYEKLLAAADAKIAVGGKYKDKFVEGKEAIENAYKSIERDVFGCEYFINKLRPDYEADPDNPEVIKLTLAYLKAQGCEEGTPFYDEVSTKWKSYASERNASLQAEFEANNPSVKAKALYDEGKFEEAVAKYQEAIAKEEDAERKANYNFSMASILFRKLNKYSEARKAALEAASLKPGWGRPYLLIGDMYAKSSRSCGDAWNQRLAVLAAMDKYSKAKSVDPSVAEEANKKIGIYSKSKPTQDEGFMRGFKEGQTLKVGCWIGESVRLRY
jgi:tetratricopeptide (TPR) repeat protein